MPRRKKQNGGGAVTQMSAVRESLKELGYDAETQRLHDHILSKYSLDIENNKISSYKSTIRKHAGYKSTRGRKAGGRVAAAAAGIGVEDIRAVKALAARIGANRLRDLIDVLA
jgi:hypothetical protein